MDIFDMFLEHQNIYRKQYNSEGKDFIEKYIEEKEKAFKSVMLNMLMQSMKEKTKKETETQVNALEKEMIIKIREQVSKDILNAFKK